MNLTLLTQVALPRWVTEVEKGSLEAMPISESLSIPSIKSSGRAVGMSRTTVVTGGVEVVELAVALMLVSIGAAAMEATMAARVMKEVSLTMMGVIV